MVITVGGIKGGSGKTTIATNLAVYLVNKGAAVLLVDADDQETATDFTAWRESTKEGDIGFTAIKLTGEQVRTQVLRLKERYEYIVIDTGGRDTTSQRAAVLVSDIYLLPFNPRSFDIWTIEKVERLIIEICSVKPTPLHVYSFINRADARGADNEDAAQLLSECNHMSYINIHIGNRKAFSAAASKGMGVMELPLNDSSKLAINEVIALFDRILNVVQ